MSRPRPRPLPEVGGVSRRAAAREGAWGYAGRACTPRRGGPSREEAGVQCRLRGFRVRAAFRSQRRPCRPAESPAPRQGLRRLSALRSAAAAALTFQGRGRARRRLLRRSAPRPRPPDTAPPAQRPSPLALPMPRRRLEGLAEEAANGPGGVNPFALRSGRGFGF